MADTIKEKLIDLIAARLSGHAWTTLTTPSTHIGRSTFDPDVDPLPVFTVLAGLEDTSQQRYGVDSNTLPITITCLMSLEDGQDVDALCEPVIGEMKVALFAGGELQILTDYFSFSNRGGGIVDYPTELGPAIINITISAELQFTNAAGDPYN